VEGATVCVATVCAGSACGASDRDFALCEPESWLAGDNADSSVEDCVGVDWLVSDFVIADCAGASSEPGGADRGATVVRARDSTDCRLTDGTEGGCDLVGVAASVCVAGCDGAGGDTEVSDDENGPASACAGVGEAAFDWSGDAY
jgi:hypothetical protein